MAAAVGRVQQQAGALGGQIAGLQRDSASLVAELARVDGQARAAAETLLRYRRTLESGGRLTEKEFGDIPGLKDFIVAQTAARQAPDVGRAFVARLERELGGARPLRAADAPRLDPAGAFTGPVGPPATPEAAAAWRDAIVAAGRVPPRESRRQVARAFQDYIGKGLSPTEALDRALREVEPGTDADPPATAERPAPPEDQPASVALPAARPPGAPRPAPSVTTPPPTDQGPRDLTPVERAEYETRGYTPEQLDRARMLKPGTIVIGPPRHPFRTDDDTSPEPTEERDRATPRVSIPDADRDHPVGVPPSGQRPRAPDSDVDAPTLSDTDRERQQALQSTDRALHRRAMAQRYAVMSERALREEWSLTTRALRQQEREIQSSERSIRRLQGLHEKRRLSPLQEIRLAETRERLQDEFIPRARTLRTERGALEEEARRRRYEVVGDRLYAPSAGPAQQGLSAFLAGAGIGAGSPGGTVVGAAMGMVSPMTAILALLGMVVGKLGDLGRQAYETEMRYLATTLPMARATGLPAQAFMRTGAEEADRYRVFELSDVLQARTGLLRATGRADLSSILPVAALTGETASEEAQRVAALSRLAPRFNPYLSTELLRAYGASAIARPRAPAAPVPPGQPGPPPPPDRQLPFDTTLYPEFAQQTGRVAQSMTRPFTRVPIEGIAEQLRAATRLRVPGIDMSTVGGLDVAGNLVQSLNQLTGRSTDAFGDMQMLGVLRLRGTDVAERLKAELGIDLSTPIGVMRAMSRAPELAARGFPQVQRGMLESMRRFMPDDDVRAMALTLSRGMDPEEAYQVTRPQAGELVGAGSDSRTRRGPGPWRVTDSQIDDAAAAMARRQDVDLFYNWNVRPETTMLGASLDLAEPIGRRVSEGMADIRDAVRQVLTDFFNSPGPANTPQLPTASNMSELSNLRLPFGQ